MKRWNRAIGNVITPTDLAQLVTMGAAFGKFDTDEETKGLVLQIPMSLHEKLDSLASRMRGMSKAKLSELFLEAGCQEFVKAIVDNDPESNIFTGDEEEMLRKQAKENQEIWDRAIEILARR